MNIKKENIYKYWEELSGINNDPIITFYKEKEDYGYFSNFYRESFNFELKDGKYKGIYPVEFSEKAIMLSKAALMDDPDSFKEILNSKSPMDSKKLGRKVKGFKQELWDDNICDIAKNVCISKFSFSEKLKKYLLDTGDLIIAEATKNDKIWAIGLKINNPDNQNISKWKGTNILGWALMETRAYLRKK
jgi:ribA/ribD-fused uncharacterized protein